MKRLIIIATITPFLQAMEHVPAVLKDIPRGVQKYLEELPRISPPQSDDAAAKARVILDYLFFIGGYRDKEVQGHEMLMSKILDCIKNNAPIIRCMPGFPVATENADKVPFAHHQCFTMADFVALLTRNHISHEIAKVHKPGSSSVIYWEPFVYDLNKACVEALGHPVYSPERIEGYQNALKAMVAVFEPYVTLAKLDRETLNQLYQRKYASLPVEIDPALIQHYEFFWKGDLDNAVWLERSERRLFEQKRADLEKRFAQIRGKLFDQIKKTPQFDKIKKLLEARAYLNQVAKQLAVLAYQGSRRMALLMEHEIEGYHKQIRESVRPDYACVQKKIGTPVIYHAEGIAWHRVLVVNAQGLDSNVLCCVDLVPFKLIRHPVIHYYRVGTYDMAYSDEEGEKALQSSALDVKKIAREDASDPVQ